MRPYGVSFIEVVVVIALLSVLGMAVWPVSELERRRQQEDDLRSALREIRLAIDDYRRDFGTGPTTFNQLLTTARSGGGFYLRALPLNPFVASTQWELTASDRGLTTDVWTPISATGTAMPGGTTMLAVRVPDPSTSTARLSVTLGKAMNGTSYKDW